MSELFRYFAYGLNIHSALPLPELITATGKADVVIRLGGIDRPHDRRSASNHDGLTTPKEVALAWDAASVVIRAIENGGGLGPTPSEVIISWGDVGRFLVRGGREVLIEPTPGVKEGVLRLFLLGRVLGALLQQRGRLVLHASAVTVQDGAVAFLGGRGWGKSTMAAAMHSRGHAVIADDVVAVDLNGSATPKIWPGFPQLKLWPDAVASMGVKPETLPRLHPEFDKRAYRPADGFSLTPLPLRRVYVLMGGEREGIDPLSPREAFLELIGHSYTAPLLAVMGAAPAHFFQCGRLAGTAPVSRLIRPPSLPSLGALAQLVVEDVAGRAASGA